MTNASRSYDAISHDYPKTPSDRLLNEMGYDMLSEARQAIQLAALNQAEPVLDVATGSGRMALALVEAGHSVVSGDIDEDMLRETQERIGHLVGVAVEFKRMNATQLDLPDASMASVVTANAMHHMKEPERVLQEMTRVLRADGKLLIVEFNERGFEAIGQVHQAVHHEQHENGSISAQGIADFLLGHFEQVKHHVLAINNVWIGCRKM